MYSEVGYSERATRSRITDCPNWAAPSIRSDPTVERVDGNVCAVSSQDNVEQYENPTYINCQDKVRQEATSRIAAMPLLPFGVTLLWHVISVMGSCEAHRTMWRTPEV